MNIDRDIDFENNTITVQKQVHIDGQKYAVSGELKTDWSKRTIPLFQPLKTALQSRTGMLITSAHGKPVTIQAWKSGWQSYIYCMETAINGISKRWYGKTKEQKLKKRGGKTPAVD